MMKKDVCFWHPFLFISEDGKTFIIKIVILQTNVN